MKLIVRHEPLRHLDEQKARSCFHAVHSFFVAADTSSYRARLSLFSESIIVSPPSRTHEKQRALISCTQK
ncbi:hypothetical protein HDV57DRAFT_493630 [Trichoderma longibrachiatum]|uniref:Uncharacterized protein n=1 Tax=Trichoderma longibrachiatum ATCC 18648 TaxID=983965 RepID=A0A2T4CG04_TRILO|nr:hypothetical protein M440DRAFT_1128258 [Trichoderma longibrachiatum ATCC 18648]